MGALVNEGGFLQQRGGLLGRGSAVLCPICGDGKDDQDDEAVGQQASQAEQGDVFHAKTDHQEDETVGQHVDEDEQGTGGEDETQDAGTQRPRYVDGEDGEGEDENAGEDGHGGGLRGLCAGAWSGGRVLFPRGERLAQFGKEGAFPLVRFKDAQVRHPVAHDGQELLRVVDAGGNQQAAVGVLLRALPGQQRALLEVAGDGGGGAQFDGEGAGGEPDVALAGEVVQMTTLAAEGGGVDDLQGVDGGEAEDFELLAAFFQGSEIPDAVFVDELIGVRVARFVAVGKAAGVTVLYGALQFGEDGAAMSSSGMGCTCRPRSSAGVSSWPMSQGREESGKTACTPAMRAYWSR